MGGFLIPELVGVRSPLSPALVHLHIVELDGALLDVHAVRFKLCDSLIDYLSLIVEIVMICRISPLKKQNCKTKLAAFN